MFGFRINNFIGKSPFLLSIQESPYIHKKRGTSLNAPLFFKCFFPFLCVLPLGTNGAKPELETITFEDKMCAGSNKWLMAHESSNEAKNGAYIGLEGENISFNILKF
jgi:hypothetical protein